MTYTPQPGDRVTSPLLVGEWEVARVREEAHWTVTQDGRRVLIHPDDLTPVAPPLPTEPAVGSVVRAHGRLWIHDHTWTDGSTWHKWSHLATAPDVCDWLDSRRAEFGGWGK